MSINEDSRISLRLSSDLKLLIEAAAAVCGQSLSAFVTSAVVSESRRVMAEHNVTWLTNRDRDAFLSALEDAHTEPNDALNAAANHYRDAVSSGRVKVRC